MLKYKTMMLKKIFSRASLVCGVSTLIITCLLVGCDRRSPESGESASADSAQVSREKHAAQMVSQVHEREALARTQQVIIRKMEAVAAKYGGDLKAASADPEMISLIQRARDLETNLSSNRAHTAEMIRARAQQSSQKEVNK